MQTRRSANYLTDAKYTLPENVTATTSFEEALKDVDYIVHTVPVQATHDYLRAIAHLVPKNVPIVNAAKGIHSETLEYMSDIIPKALGNPQQPMAFLSGPSFAKELVENVPTVIVIASHDKGLRERVQILFHSLSLRVYTNADVVGVEIGGALKNVFAIAAGICDGVGLGSNSMAAMVTRGCSEMTRLAIAMGGQPATLAGLSGIGDLMLTCYGALSRNRTVGVRIGKGETLAQIRASTKEVAEGVATTPAAARLAKQLNLDCPIIQAVNMALAGSASAHDLIKELMSMPAGDVTSFYHRAAPMPQ